MQLTDKDIALLMVACDNTSAGLREAVRRGAADRCQDEAEGLDDLYNRLNNERVAREEERENPSRWSGLTVYK
jgi:hypothetical protein